MSDRIAPNQPSAPHYAALTPVSCSRALGRPSERPRRHEPAIARQSFGDTAGSGAVGGRWSWSRSQREHEQRGAIRL